jgi:tetratricopeptide (TPR) repeat protein
VLQNIDNANPAKIKYLDKSIILLEHWQIQGVESRSKYIVGLAHDCYFHPQSDRNSHYLGRECLWTGRPKTAIKEFIRHVEMNKWPTERSQSMIFIGDAYGLLNQPELQIAWYNKAFFTDSSRREALIKIARFYKHNDNFRATAAFASAALEIPFTPYYANDMRHYGAEPHEILYFCYGWTGDIPGAQKHILKALAYEPLNPKLLDETKFYFEYPDNKIDGWMTFPELQFLYEMSKKMDTICEVGSWKGRSTHALLSGCKGTVTAVDTFAGSAEELDATHDMAKKEDIYAQFIKNVGIFKNLKIKKGFSVDVAKDIPDKSYDMTFIDASHDYENVTKDIKAWLPKTKIIICGHDYSDVWPNVMRAIDENIGMVDGVVGSIWYKWLI